MAYKFWESWYKEPSNYKEAITSKDSKKWIKAMDEDYQYLMKNKTWVLVPKPPGSNNVGVQLALQNKGCD